MFSKKLGIGDVWKRWGLAKAPVNSLEEKNVPKGWSVLFVFTYDLRIGMAPKKGICHPKKIHLNS